MIGEGVPCGCDERSVPDARAGVVDALPTVLDWYSVVTSAAVVFVALAGVRYVVHCMHVHANETYVSAVSAFRSEEGHVQFFINLQYS